MVGAKVQRQARRSAGVGRVRLCDGAVEIALGCLRGHLKADVADVAGLVLTDQEIGVAFDLIL